MRGAPQTIQLTPLQIAHAIPAVRDRISVLERQADESAQGGEHEDVLILQSVLKLLVAAGEAAMSSSGMPG